MKLKCKIWLEENGKQVFGDGIYRLLILVDSLGSINQAAKREKMSYRQAWGKIKRMENRLNIRLLNRRIGGQSGGGATLTRQGKMLIEEYKRLSQEVDNFIDETSKRFNDIFEEIAGDDNERSIP